LVLRNPKAGTGVLGERIEHLLDTLRQHNFKIEVLSDLGQLSDRSRELWDRGVLRTVVAAGGDGTAETVVNLTPAAVPLSVFPLGTENLLAKYLGVNSDPADVVETIAAGQVVQLDVGQLRKKDDEQARLFLLMMGCGFDAEVVHRLHEERTGNINHLSWAKPIIESIRSYEYPPLKVTCRETPTSPPSRVITAHWAFIFNTPVYAGGLGICPDAVPYDGQLDVTTFEGGSFWQGLMHLSAVILGQHKNLAGVERVRTPCLTVEAEQDVPFQVDGDPGGSVPVDIQILPERLSMMVPVAWLEQTKTASEGDE
jgi:YegS/Rv2252/BmrU family lipid kinase